AEDGIRDFHVTGVQTCALPIYAARPRRRAGGGEGGRGGGRLARAQRTDRQPPGRPLRDRRTGQDGRERAARERREVRAQLTRARRVVLPGLRPRGLTPACGTSNVGA